MKKREPFRLSRCPLSAAPDAPAGRPARPPPWRAGGGAWDRRTRCRARAGHGLAGRAPAARWRIPRHDEVRHVADAKPRQQRGVDGIAVVDLEIAPGVMATSPSGRAAATGCRRETGSRRGSCGARDPPGCGACRPAPGRRGAAHRVLRRGARRRATRLESSSSPMRTATSNPSATRSCRASLISSCNCTSG